MPKIDNLTLVTIENIHEDRKVLMKTPAFINDRKIIIS